MKRGGTFLSDLAAQRIDDRYWFLTADLGYRTSSGAVIIVPRRFITDFASVPRWLTVAYALFGGTASPAAAVHDWLYQTHAAPRDVSDWTLYDAARALGEPEWRCHGLWVGVRIGGAARYADGPSRFRMKNLDLHGGTHSLVIPHPLP